MTGDVNHYDAHYGGELAMYPLNRPRDKRGKSCVDNGAIQVVQRVT